MAMTAAQVSNLSDEISGLSVTIVSQDILAAGYERMIAGRLATQYQFPGIGSVLNLPFTAAVDFGAATGEGTEVTHVVGNIKADAVTMAKYTLDVPVSLEGENWGAGSALAALTADAGRAYANKVDGLIHAAANAATSIDQTNAGSAVTMVDVVTAYQKLLLAKAPPPYVMLLHPEHFVDLFGTTTTIFAGVPGTGQALERGPNAATGFLGQVGGFDIYVDPNCTGTGATARSVFFSPSGLYWVWKPTAIPGAANGALGVELAWRYDFRSWVMSATMIGAAAVRRLPASTTQEWVGNMKTTT